MRVTGKWGFLLKGDRETVLGVGRARHRADFSSGRFCLNW
jgi:hypothetical protein